jgi:hypothetical protein
MRVRFSGVDKTQSGIAHGMTDEPVALGIGASQVTNLMRVVQLVAMTLVMPKRRWLSERRPRQASQALS